MKCNNNRIPSSTLILIQLSGYLVVGFFVFWVDNHPDNFHCFFSSVGIGALIKLFDLKPKTDNMYPYSEAYLNSKKNDLAKRWYISFMVYDVQKQKKIRKWDYTVNAYNTIRERRSYAKKRIVAINSLLEKGYHIDSSKAEPDNLMSVENAVEYALNASSVNHISSLSYRSVKNLFIKWASNVGLDILPVDNFNSTNVYMYRDMLKKEGKCGVTINKNVSVMKRLWNILLKRDLVKNNPWIKIEKEKQIITNRNIAFTWNEVTKLLNLISKQDKELFYFIKMIYHTLARPTELRNLQVYNIKLSKKRIYIEAWKTKSKRERWINIHNGLIDTIIELTKNKTSSDYLFPGTEPGKPISKNRMTDRHRAYLKKLDLFDGEHTLYSWKHTGVIEAYEAGVDLKSIQLQCGHSSIMETDKYLKSLGLYDNHEIIIKQPALPL